MKPVVCLLLLLLFPTVLVAGEQQYRIWLVDKTGSPCSLENPTDFLSPRAIAQREKENIPIDSTDLPVSTEWLKQLSESGARILATSKWLNTVTIALTDASQISAIGNLPFVKGYEALGSPVLTSLSVRSQKKQQIEDDTPYGDATLQIALHNGDKLHQAGFSGQGMTIAVIDGGFLHADRNPRFDQNHIAGWHDFVDDQIDFEHGDTHGSSVLSTMLVNDSNTFIGTAPKASYWLLRSEDTATEYPAEEDFWVAALEYADSLGVDVITSSLGYSQFDNPQFDHSWEQLDGKTTFISCGAAMGVKKGLLIIVSAGNERAGSWKKITVPADVDGLLTVGAVDTQRKPAYFSGCGFTSDGRIKPDVAGLGTSAATIDPNGGLLSKDGTSFSTPIIAGLTACLRQALPDLPAREIIDLIRQNSSQYLTPDSLMGYGIPDFYAAYRQGSGIETPQTPGSPLRLAYRQGIPIVTVAGLPANEREIMLDIYNLEGTIIREYRLGEGSEVVLHELSKGIYLLSARSKTHCWTQKIKRL